MNIRYFIYLLLKNVLIINCFVLKPLPEGGSANTCSFPGSKGFPNLNLIFDKKTEFNNLFPLEYVNDHIFKNGLEKSYQLWTMNNPNIKMIHANLTQKLDVERIMEGMDIVVQAAAITSGIKDIADKPHTFISDNAVMNSMILRSAFDHSIEHLPA